jgi:formylglycine-generating enzyme required for sulfatase activity
MFLKVYAEDNPYTDEDDVLRESVNDDVSEPWIDISAFDKISVDLIASTMTTLIDRYRKPATANDVIAESLGKDCDVCPEMMKVPAGNFQMGDLNGKGYVEEKPTHRVELNPFALSRTEITFEQYDAFARDTNNQLPEDRDWGRDDRAVIYVSWHEANTYAKWLSEKTNKHYRLPSEAEWEYAARAGSNTVYFWGNEIGHDKANCDGCGSDWDDKKTAPVAQFESNQLGLFDMHGNVWEWVQDCHRNSYNETPKDGTAVTQHPCTQRVLRGGSWFNKPSDLRAAARYGSDPNRRRGHFGFRIAQDLEPTLAVEETTPD